MTRDEVERRDAQMAEKHCYRLCLGCEGCMNFQSSMQRCVSCAPEHRRCICGMGWRRFLTTDGFLAVSELTDHRGTDKTIHRFVKIRQVVAPQIGTDKNLIGLDQISRNTTSHGAPDRFLVAELD